MESIKATSLNRKVGTFLHLIPGIGSVHLDTPMSHVLVHGIPTSKSLAEIATELTTFNTGLSLRGQPRWLTTDDARAGKAASTVIISITDPEGLTTSENAWPPSHQPIELNFASVVTPTLSVPTATAMHTTTIDAPTWPHAGGVPPHTSQEITPAPPLPAAYAVDLATIPYSGG